LDQLVREPDSLFGERELSELVQTVADDPSLVFSMSSYSKFMTEVDFQRFSLASDKVTINYFKKHMEGYRKLRRPQLLSLLRLSSGMDISLVLILQEPLAAAKIAACSVDLSAEFPIFMRHNYDEQTRSAVEKLLQRELSRSTDGNIRSLSEILDEVEPDSTTVKRWFPVLAREIGRRHRRHTKAVVSRRRRAMTKLLRSGGLLAAYRSGRIGSQDSIVNILVLKTGARISHARRVLSKHLAQTN
jgi:hypothetical protein